MKSLTVRLGSRQIGYLQNALKCAVMLTLMIGLFLVSDTQAFTLNVEGCDAANVCTPLPGGFRYLVEEDNTTLTIPQTVQINPPSATLAIHKSHAPVVTSGASAGSSATVTVPAGKRYFITVLPDAGYALGGAPNSAIGAGGSLVFKDPVTVRVNQHPLPTAQVTIFAHIDHNPINNTWDQYDGGLSGAAIPTPTPLNGGLGRATVTIYDAAGQVMFDINGNPLGTMYDAGGNVIAMGTGVVTTMTAADVNNPLKNPYNLKIGEALIKYISPNKYGVKVVPPQFDDSGNPISWVQTSTIEGTQVIDAWVKANEPRQFIEGFGQGFNHVAFGFVKVSPASESVIAGQSVKVLPWNITNSADPDYVNRAGFTGSIQGTVRLNHFSRPPSLQGYFPGPPVAECWVGLNNPVATPGLQPSGLYAAPCNPATGEFVINNVPPGTYQLVYWDKPLDFLFGFNTVTVPAGTGGTGEAVNLGNVLAYRWFGTLEGSVFHDVNENGFRDAGETGIASQNINLRFRDGSMYQTTPTDVNGEYELAEVFPFFNWLVAEVDFARFKATGMTTAIDYGGQITSSAWPANGNKALQPQNPSDPFNIYQTTDYRTETGPVLLEAIQLFLGQTNLIDFGKTTYSPGENGGIAGIVYYSVTRAENEPRFGAAETWEPGIPRVQVCLYQDNLTNATGATVPDGIIDDINGIPGVQLCDVDNYPFGWAEGTAPRGPEDVIRSGDGITFSLGDALQATSTDSWDDNNPSRCIQDRPIIHGIQIPECADGFGTWNQVRPGVFDGGYAFGSPVGDPDLAAGTYIVEAVMPDHYGIVKEEDKNVDFGETFTVSRQPLATQLLPPVCVGTVDNGQPLHIVPNELALFPGVPIDPPLAGSTTPLCNMKQVTVRQAQNSAADFQFITEVPKAARVIGFVLNDLTAEFNAGSPVFGEKLAAKWIPVSFKDWTGKEITRVYSDEFGTYNALLPSTYSVNIPCPTGVSPSMITLVLNDPNLPDGTLDPYYDPTYVIAPWTLNYMPGKTTYVDTPIVPIRAFAAMGAGFSTAPADGTPVIRSLDGPGTGIAPLICTNTDPLPTTVTITSLGPTVVIDPATGTNVTRDYGFGATQGSVTLNGTALSIVSWSAGTIVATVPAGATTGTIMVTRGGAGGLTTEIGVTLTITDCATTGVRNVPSAYPTIQSAINAASAGDLILVAPGTYYENVIMYKPVHLQGAGAGATFINANPNPLERLQAFHAFLDALGARDFAAYMQGDPFTVAEAPGIFVIGELIYPNGTALNPLPGTKTLNPGNSFSTTGQASIDGFTISGSKAGGGIYGIAGASNLTISNNNVTNNQGNLAGGIGLGIVGFDSQNDNVIIRNNRVHSNGGVDGSGGIAMNEGSENYLVESNIVMGNFSRFNGGGIAHNGFSPGNNIIRKNKILFNEVFFGALLNTAGDGGGIFVGDTVAGAEGTGNVTIEANLIQGNLTGAGSGAGIRAFAVNAQDVADSPANDASWYRLNIVNNIIVNNVAAVAGAGISLQDVLRVNIVNNTIANNDSTATGVLAFAAGAANSTPQPSGVVSGVHSSALLALITLPGEPNYSNPVLLNNIIWHNRSFFNDASLNGGAGGLAPNPDGPYWDLAVINAVTPPALDPDYCILSALTGGPGGKNYNDGTNIAADPGFVLNYSNILQSASVIDEGGNSINVLFTPLDPAAGNYHITPASPAVNTGNSAGAPTTDYDAQARPNGPAPDIGADEVYVTAPPLVITTTSLPGGVVGTAYPATTLTATGGFGPKTWSVSAGALPGGLTLSAAGVITGTPTAPGTFNFTVQVTDSSGTATKPLSIIVTVGPLTITTTSLPGGVVGTAYPATTLTATGGFGPKTWSLVAGGGFGQPSGGLPGGLTLSAAGVITGTPTAPGTFNFTVRVTDSSGSVTKSLSIVVAAP
ncbi:MAG: putative Ig domain-containing protein [Nitrospirae bacterium]|nr:putative Ig domain-containing protein [Nitrospirota bacterium]